MRIEFMVGDTVNAYIPPEGTPFSMRAAVYMIESEIMREALNQHATKAAAARSLNMSPGGFRAKWRRLRLGRKP